MSFYMFLALSITIFIYHLYECKRMCDARDPKLVEEHKRISQYALILSCILAALAVYFRYKDRQP